MGLIKKVENELGTIYERYDSNNKLIQRAGAIGFSKEYEGNIYYIITDLNGIKINEANRFLNYSLEKVSEKKREQAFSALKIFYSFIDLFHIKDYEKGLNNEVLKKLIGFLKGGTFSGNTLVFDFNLERKNSTIRYYLSVYRKFYELIFNIRVGPLHDRTSLINYQHENGVRKIEKYNSNPQSPSKNVLPKYIRYEEYQKILEIIDAKFNLRDRIIVMLMYEYGLRIGEVLGITIEDINFEKNKNGYYSLKIRNRITDKSFQHGKRLIVPKKIEHYFEEEYALEGIGLWTILIEDEELIEIIEEYYEEARDARILNKFKKKRDNLKYKSKADKVTDRNDLRENQYIFLNQQNYTPLTASGWGYRIKKILENAGIEIDRGTKKNNLSHRFRHGFAMKKVAEGYDEIKLYKVLRHSGPHSVKYYFNPTPEDQADMLRGQKENMEMRGLAYVTDIKK
ncbi:integrase/recombinase XerD [Lysinibacillus composti]|uniref:tyrosine-type recombinase/integrase n=1 Tax=Lysinibacillus composti TaxID=720633 RepID=UPI001315AAAC|nr:tyrosine-type recombinase/integrase [Lysinibacillus composti]MBM7607245.1 integrase/recombinase XerD [Lysinibacillus composti]